MFPCSSNVSRTKSTAATCHDTSARPSFKFSVCAHAQDSISGSKQLRWSATTYTWRFSCFATDKFDTLSARIADLLLLSKGYDVQQSSAKHYFANVSSSAGIYPHAASLSVAVCWSSTLAYSTDGSSDTHEASHTWHSSMDSRNAMPLPTSKLYETSPIHRV